MNREQFKNEVRGAAVRAAPEMAVAIVEEIVESPAIQKFFDNCARKRPGGLVARFRRWRGRVGLDESDKQQLEEYIRMMAEKRRR